MSGWRKRATLAELPARDAELIRLYTVEHWTMQRIADKFEMTRQGVQRRIKHHGLCAYDGEHVIVPCHQCGKPIDVVRSRLRRQMFCNMACRSLFLGNPNYVQHRWSGMQARNIVRRLFLTFSDKHVVHHKDSNQTNNDISNLAVFASQSDHRKFHHRDEQVKPVWDGAEFLKSQALERQSKAEVNHN